MIIVGFEMTGAVQASQTDYLEETQENYIFEGEMCVRKWREEGSEWTVRE